MIQREIYLDNSATTRISEGALNKYIEISREFYGNPSSLHTLGFNAEKIITSAKDTILSTLSAKGSSVIFTASGSEANNLAIIGRALSKERYLKGAKIITSDGEHASVNEPLSRLEALGFKIVRIPTKNGTLDMKKLAEELTPDTILVSMMMVNNETGALYDISAVSRLVKSKVPTAALHVDATQSYMKVPFTKSGIGADMITISSHKIEGPKGVGALVVDNRIINERGLSPIIFGGGQEGGLRSGTENVPGIAAFAEAAKIAKQSFPARFEKYNLLRETLINRIEASKTLSGISITSPTSHAPHILNITLPGIKSETMLHYLSSFGIFVSSGSACSSNDRHVSSALVAYGRSEREADSSIRISFSDKNEISDIDALVGALESGVEKLARVK